MSGCSADGSVRGLGPWGRRFKSCHPDHKFLWPVGQAVKTSPFHGGNGGSIPPRVTSFFREAEKDRHSLIYAVAIAEAFGPRSGKRPTFLDIKRSNCGATLTKLIQVRGWRDRSAGVAQLAEQLICNQQVAGSSPITSSIMGKFPSGQRGQTVNLLSQTSVVRIHLSPPFLKQ